MTDFADWKGFDYDNSTVQLWVFKKSTAASRFRAWHVRTDRDIEQLFRNTIKREVDATTEAVAYTPISQNNESSCLTHALEESEGLIALLDRVDAPETENLDAELNHLKGAAGYLVKFQFDDRIVYAIRRTSPTWKPKIRSSLINAIFRNGELSAAPDETFSFDSFFDFYCLNETVFVKAKRAYESTMSEKGVYQRSFEQLAVDANFTSLFSDIQPLMDYVGTNAMQLRRITVIQQKALYMRPEFSQRVRAVNEVRGFGLRFDERDRIVACQDTAKTIMQILLDHRLISEITDTVYDVPDTEAV